MIRGRPFQVILEVVCSARGVTEFDLVGPRGPALVSNARQEVCWLARRVTKMSYPAIGFRLGHRDHTTILHAEGRVNERLTNDPDYAQELNDLLTAVSPQNLSRLWQGPLRRDQWA